MPFDAKTTNPAVAVPRSGEPASPPMTRTETDRDPSGWFQGSPLFPLSPADVRAILSRSCEAGVTSPHR